MAEVETKDADSRYPNLRPIQPGEVRNPTGRNGKVGLREIRAFLDRRAEPSSRHTRRENLLLAIYTTAIDRRRRDHVAAARLLLSYDVGQPPQVVDYLSSYGSANAPSLAVHWVDAQLTKAAAAAASRTETKPGDAG